MIALVLVMACGPLEANNRAAWVSIMLRVVGSSETEHKRQPKGLYSSSTSVCPSSSLAGKGTRMEMGDGT